MGSVACRDNTYRIHELDGLAMINSIRTVILVQECLDRCKYFEAVNLHSGIFAALCKPWHNKPLANGKGGVMNKPKVIKFSSWP